jgi:cytochrome b561/polyisoprenoid-binding protein YceI
MMLRNTSERWGTVSQLLHWVIVALVATQFTLAYLAAGLPLGLHKLALLARHKSFGITILALALVRLAWRLSSRGPGVPENLNAVERRLASGTHAGLYACLFLMPLTGWLMSSAKKYPVSWFGLAQLPDLVAPNEALFSTLRAVHQSISYALLALILLHVAGALRHQFVLKDNLMKRMLPCVCLALLILGPAKVRADEWTVDPGRSKLSFSFTQAGAVNTGKFDKFIVTLSGRADALASAKLDVTVDIASINTGDKDRDDTLRGPDLFDAKKYPTGRFAAAGLEPKGSGKYLASGNLTLRSVSRPVRLPLSFREVTEGGQPVLYLDGSVTVNRLDFGIGQGDWQSTEWVGNAVPIKWSVRLVRKH